MFYNNTNLQEKSDEDFNNEADVIILEIQGYVKKFMDIRKLKEKQLSQVIIQHTDIIEDVSDIISRYT